MFERKSEGVMMAKPSNQMQEIAGKIHEEIEGFSPSQQNEILFYLKSTVVENRHSRLKVIEEQINELKSQGDNLYRCIEELKANAAN